MLRRYLTLALFVLLPTYSFAQNPSIIQKPILCTTQSHMKEIIKANHLEIIMLSRSKVDVDIQKIILINPNKNLLFIHIINKSDIACIIDDMEEVESTLDLVPKSKS